VKRVRWYDANSGVLVAKLPTGDFPRERGERILNPFWVWALHWSRKWWYEHKI
jgi:hypothetical protein